MKNYKQENKKELKSEDLKEQADKLIGVTFRPEPTLKKSLNQYISHLNEVK